LRCYPRAVPRADAATVLREWTERDLTATAKRGELTPAFEVDDQLRRIGDVLASGRHPVLCGESGVGKSAIIHELVRRTEAGSGPPQLAGKRVLQISFRSRAAVLLKPEQIRPATQKLVDALVASSDDVVPFFRDLHLAYELDLEPQLQLLAVRFRGAVLGEAHPLTFDRMLEHTAGLEQHYVGLPIAEPDLLKMEAILERWSAEQRANGRIFTPAAQREAVQLAHRFLSRARMPRKVIDFLTTVGSVVEAGRTVDSADVLERFYEAYKVPRFLIDPGMTFDVEATERAFRARVLGQAEAVRTVVRMISLIKSGLSDTRRPFGAFLFVGPTGVGKTHVAQMLAEYLFGSRDRMIRLNMADFASPNAPYTLFGNPEGYTPTQRRGLITQRLSGHPFGVLLLDEFEKAFDKVHDRFLQLLDEGAFINGDGETVSCRSMIVIATSNAGAEVYRGRPLGFGSPPDVEEMDRQLDRMLYRSFRFELLNRFDEIVRFRPLTREDIRTIALREIEALRERSGLKARGLALEVDEAILDWLTAHGYDPHFGARFLRRTIERHVTTAVAEAIVREPLAAGSRVALRVRGGRIAANVVERPGDKERPEAVRVAEGTGAKVLTLDRKSLVAHARSLLDAAKAHLQRLEERQNDASGLLATMAEPHFWDDPADAQRVMDRYRRLDVAIQAETRLAEPLRRLAEMVSDGSSSSPAGSSPSPSSPSRPIKTEWLARAVERASEALADWDERIAEEGGGAVWLLSRNVDPLVAAGSWLEELAEMHLAWCRHLELAAETVAVGFTDDTLARVVIEVEGPGAAAYMMMEHGVHRLHRERGDLRVRVDVVPRVERKANGHARTTAVRRRAGALGVEIAYAGRVERDDTGMSLELGGPTREVIEALLADLDVRAAELVAPLEIARIYAQGGSGARDPRSGALVPRYKDAMRGKLDPLLEAWRRAKRSETEARVQGE
jgi:ATP-dependent Clp protease ATP-binding subunit ClpC